MSNLVFHLKLRACLALWLRAYVLPKGQRSLSQHKSLRMYQRLKHNRDVGIIYFCFTVKTNKKKIIKLQFSS